MRSGALAVAVLALAACSSTVVEPESTVAETTTAGASTTSVGPTTTVVATTTTVLPTTTTTNPFARPDWLGTQPLPLRPDEHGEVQPTPPELVDRQLETLDLLGPATMVGFEAAIEPIPPDVLARSSWTEECPVTVEELRYITMTHVGFDGEFHVGEMIVNARFAEGIVEIFRKLFEARFPIEQMRVITAEEIEAHPTGDWNDTTSFVCRPAVGSANWSQHAYGLAIDINPFHNPYLKGDLVLPELASAYLDRGEARRGMIVEGDVVTEAFDEIGWGWGGRWNSLKDWMHFSYTGR